jgi:thioesterase domain-containing protein
VSPYAQLCVNFPGILLFCGNEQLLQTIQFLHLAPHRTLLQNIFDCAKMRILSRGSILEAQELQTYLHNHIPITKAMGVEVRKCGYAGVELFAPLAPNINHRDTVFGGSASTLAILSAWALLHVRMADKSVRPRLVIQQNTMSYDQPIITDFYAVCHYQDKSEWARFETTLARRGRARITVPAVLECQGDAVAKFEGRFVAVMPK